MQPNELTKSLLSAIEEQPNNGLVTGSITDNIEPSTAGTVSATNTAHNAQLAEQDPNLDLSYWFFGYKLAAYTSLGLEVLYAYFLSVSIGQGTATLADFLGVRSDVTKWISLVSAFTFAGLNLGSDLLSCVAIEEAKEMQDGSSTKAQLDAAVAAGDLKESQKNLAWRASYYGHYFALFTAWLIGASADAITIAYLTSNTIARLTLGILAVFFGVLMYRMSFDKKITNHMIALFKYNEGIKLIEGNRIKGVEFLRRVTINSLNRAIGFGFIAMEVATIILNVSPKNSILATYVALEVVFNALVTLFSRSLASYDTLLYKADKRKGEINAILSAFNRSVETVTIESKLSDLERILTAAGSSLPKETLKLTFDMVRARLNQAATESNNTLTDEQVRQATDVLLGKLTAEQRQMLQPSVWQIVWNFCMALTFALPISYFIARLFEEYCDSLPLYASYGIAAAVATPVIWHNMAARRLLDPEFVALKAIDNGEQQLLATYTEAATFEGRYKELTNDPKIGNLAFIVSRGGRFARWIANVGFISSLAQFFTDNNWSPAWTPTDVFMLNLMIGTLAFEADGPVFDEMNRDTLAKHWVRAEWACAWAKQENKSTLCMLNAFFLRTDDELAHMRTQAEKNAEQFDVEANTGVSSSCCFWSARREQEDSMSSKLIDDTALIRADRNSIL